MNVKQQFLLSTFETGDQIDERMEKKFFIFLILLKPNGERNIVKR